jgi:hypothetical protein
VTGARDSISRNRIFIPPSLSLSFVFFSFFLFVRFVCPFTSALLARNLHLYKGLTGVVLTSVWLSHALYLSLPPSLPSSLSLCLSLSVSLSLSLFDILLTCACTSTYTYIPHTHTYLTHTPALVGTEALHPYTPTWFSTVFQPQSLLVWCEATSDTRRISFT